MRESEQVTVSQAVYRAEVQDKTVHVKKQAPTRWILRSIGSFSRLESLTRKSVDRQRPIADQLSQ